MEEICQFAGQMDETKGEISHLVALTQAKSNRKTEKKLDQGCQIHKLVLKVLTRPTK